MNISATILSLLKVGDVRQIFEHTGVPYAVHGIVIHGAGRGKQLNYPTANLGHEPENQIAPRDGIYAGWATVRGEKFAAAISIGFNPTFGEGRHSIEAHLLDFDDDIYDEPITIHFAERIRDEMKFQNVQQLIEQIGRDVQECRAILEAEKIIK